MKLEFIKYKGLGKFNLGISLRCLENHLGSMYRIKQDIFFSGSKRIFYQNYGLFFDLEENDTVEAIETIRKNKVIFNGKVLFDLNRDEVRKTLSQFDDALEENNGFTSKELGISLYFEEGKDYASSIIAFKKGYYDRQPDLNPVVQKGPDSSIDDLYKLL